MISVINVTKKYNKHVTALENVSFNIKRGEFVFLTGKSGSGKTTLFKILFKEELPTSGDVFIFGKNIRRMRTKKLRRRIGVVFQDYKLLEKKTVYENVSYPLACLGMNPFKVRRETKKILRKMNIDQLAKKKVNELSGGEQQRVAIARAIINKPEVLLCDEPTGNLDAENTEIIVNYLKQLNEEGTTVVMTTHDAEIIKKVGKRVIVLDQGKVISDGFMEQLEQKKNEKDKQNEEVATPEEIKEKLVFEEAEKGII